MNKTIQLLLLISKVRAYIDQLKDILQEGSKSIDFIIFNEYVDLAKQVKYSKFEIYADATGDDLSNIAARVSGQIDTDGLQSKEAVRKLRGLLKGSDIDPKQGQESVN
jgi:hypothetical protein